VPRTSPVATGLDPAAETPPAGPDQQAA